MKHEGIGVRSRAMAHAVAAVAVVIACSLPVWAQPEAPRIEKNVVYGMHSGLALLLDVHRPERPNGLAILFIPGGGWLSAPGADAAGLKNEPHQVPFFVPALSAAGFTVFVINHRAAPLHHFPLPVEDAARAVRFIRYHSGKYGVDADRIGAVGYSSGANLVAMLATNSKAAMTGGKDAVGRESARISCAVAIAAPVDLCAPTVPQGQELVVMYLGERPSCEPGGLPKSGIVTDASPAAQVTADSAPTLFVHGTADKLVPIASVERMAAALAGLGVPVKVLPLKGAGHWPVTPPGGAGPHEEIVGWLNQYLIPRPPSGSN